MRARATIAAVLMAPLGAYAGSEVLAPAADDGYGFFDYLGEMVEDDAGEWVDPLDMETFGGDADAQSDDDDGRAQTAPEDDDDE